MHPPRPLQRHYCVGIYTRGNQVGNSESLSQSSLCTGTARDIRDQKEIVTEQYQQQRSIFVQISGIHSLIHSHLPGLLAVDIPVSFIMNQSPQIFPEPRD